ncbi:MAG: hypothetical protein SynsKO_37490 [Synoicihabitans sp.]
MFLNRIWIWLKTPQGAKAWRPGLVLLYLLTAVGLVSKLSEYYVPGYGFTYLIGQGDEPVREFDWIEERDVTVYRHFRSSGYDAQYYAQLALDPALRDPTLAQSVDNVPYRARRILLPWTAFLLGFGQANWVLNVYALQNVVCWFLLGFLLLRWFPPTDFARAFRWLAIMLSIGIWFSAFFSLVDGPSLLLLALALRWIERGQQGWATAVLALSGLAKETNLLGAAVLAPERWQSLKGWGRAVLQGILVAIPLVIWFLFLRQRFAETGSLAGARNFAWPFQAYGERWVELFQAAIGGETRWKFLSTGLATHISVTVQALFLLLWWQWKNAAWRLTVPFAALAFVLGYAVWEGYPGASSRVLLPMLLGFNLLVPYARRWWPILVLGNLTMWIGPISLEPRPGETYSVQIESAPQLLALEKGRADLEVEFPRPWYRAERNRKRQWRWSESDADIVINNPYPVALEIEIRGEWSAQTDRTARLTQNGTLLWQQPITPRPREWRLAGIRLEPGENRLRVESDAHNVVANPGDERRLAVCLLRFSIKGRVAEIDATD